MNSERIAAAFGTYGVEVLEQDEQVRVSNLFSGAGADKTCRTFAIVRYAPRIDAAVRAEHAEIVAGGSIGAVFAAHGWEVRKTHLGYSERPASARLASLMRVDVGTPLAEHVYVLDVVKDGRKIEYAALAEIHHPDYLDLADLPVIKRARTLRALATAHHLRRERTRSAEALLTAFDLAEPLLRHDHPHESYPVIEVLVHLPQHFREEIVWARHLNRQVRHHDPVARFRNLAIQWPARGGNERDIWPPPQVGCVIKNEQCLNHGRAE